jgi:hypothetical protein
MNKKLLNESDSIINIIFNFLESFLVDGEEKTSAKFLEELRNELNNPIKFDTNEIINEFLKKRPKIKGRTRIYISYKRWQNGKKRNNRPPFK